jgi:signal transduction histidine kinase
MNIINLLNQRMIQRNTLFNEFAIFFIIFSIFPYLIWRDNVWIDSYILKFISGSMCIILFTKEIWSYRYRKYFALFWYLCVFISLPLTHSVILVQNDFAEWAIINFVFSTFILSFIIDWDLSFSFLVIALLIAMLYTNVFLGINPLKSITTIKGGWFIYSLLSSVAISFVFIRNNEGFYNLSLKKAKQAFGIIVHEIKNPLATLQLLNANYKNQDDVSLESKNKFLYKTNILIKDIYYILEDVLVKLQVNRRISLKKLSIRRELIKVIDNYPFKDQDKSFIKINLEKDFNFTGDSKFFKFIIFNILNNSLFYQPQIENFQIKVYAEIDATDNILIIEDNGVGISEKDILYIFDGFYTTKSNGTGLGMFFCKKVMLKFKGDIVCESQLGQYTKFKLIFPSI